MRIRLPQALPSLGGVRGRIVRVAYVLLAAVAAAVAAGSLLFNGLDYFRNMPNAASYGFMTYTDPQTRVAIGEIWSPGSGLRRGDLLVAIDGRRLRPGATEFDVGAMLGRTGDRIALDVDRGGSRHRVTLDRQPGRWSRMLSTLNMPLWLYAGFSYAVGQFHPLFLLAASLLLFLRRPRDPEAMLFAFGFLLMCARSDLTWWMDPIFGIGDTARGMVSATAWVACTAAVAGFPDGRFTTLWSRISVMVIAASLAPILYWASMPDMVVTVIFLAMLAMSIVSVLLRWRSTADQIARQQMKWAVTGFCVMALGVGVGLSPPVTSALYAMGQPFGYIATRLIGTAGYVALPLGLLVSLLRYRLYDAETAIGRSAVFAVLTLGLLGVFAGTEKVIEALGEEYFGESIGALAGGIAAALAAVLIVPMHRRVEHWAERSFRGDLLKLRRELPALVGDLRETADAQAVGDAVAARAMRGVRARRVVVLAGEEVAASRDIAPEAFARWRAGWQPPEGGGIVGDSGDPLLPMRVPLDADGCGHVGWLLLGPRPDGSLYNKEEREALAEIADPVARAFHIVRQREARREAVDGRMSALERRFAALEAAVARLGGDVPAAG